ncbi:MAG TPA: FecR family protein [Hanamia sp.]
MDKNYFIKLLQKYRQGNVTNEEGQFLESYYNLFQNEPDILTRLSEEEKKEMKEHLADRVWDNISKIDGGRTKIRSINTRFLRVAAAAVLFIVGAYVYRILNKKIDIQSKTVAINEKHPIMPGGNKAFLIRSDGSKIVLDSIQNGTVLQKGSTKIIKQSGILIYNVSAFPNQDEVVVYNTLSTPRGGQYQVVLSDGTKVWLNASSSLHFPTAFIGNERNVELTGEAYFEVAKNKEKPFHVNVINGMQIEVLGTHFNVNAYGDEGAIKTSLLEGSIKIKKGNVSGLLKPGQQGVLNKNGGNIEIKNVDMNEVIAWKNGLFQFDGADIKSIMGQIGRWYDVEIEYDGKMPERKFEGKISRDAKLTDVLKILELSNVKFSVQGKIIIVQ